MSWGAELICGIRDLTWPTHMYIVDCMPDERNPILMLISYSTCTGCFY
jgi:hypothetical protein